MPRAPSRTARIEARISPEGLAVVKRAAELEGLSVSDFVIRAAQDAAQRLVEEASLIRLAVEDQRRFVERLLAPAPDVPAPRRARKAHADLIRDPRPRPPASGNP